MGFSHARRPEVKRKYGWVEAVGPNRLYLFEVYLVSDGRVRPELADTAELNHCVTRKNWLPGAIPIACPFVAEGTNVHGPVTLVELSRQPRSGIQAMLTCPGFSLAMLGGHDQGIDATGGDRDSVQWPRPEQALGMDDRNDEGGGKQATKQLHAL